MPANTVNRRLCGSSMQLHDAARMIMTGDASVCLIGGVEHMEPCANEPRRRFPSGPQPQRGKGGGMMGLTAEMLARLHGISREMQDQFAARSRSCLGRNPVRHSKRRLSPPAATMPMAYSSPLTMTGDPPGNHRRDAVHA